MLTITILSFAGMCMLFMGFFPVRKWTMPISLLILFTGLVTMFGCPDTLGIWAKGMLSFGGGGKLVSGMLMLSGILVLPFYQISQEKDKPIATSDFSALVIFAVIGGIMMATFSNLIVLFLGIEILSIAMYILTGSARDDIRSNEGAIKYLLQGAFASAIFLFGAALYYGGTRTLTLTEWSPQTLDHTMTIVGVLLLFIGMAFKVGLAPFHVWVPDVYQGAQARVTATMAMLVKIAGFAALVRFILVLQGGGALLPGWFPGLVAAITLLTLILGNVMAAVQVDVKRLLAYSSIGHAGFIFMAFCSGAPTTVDAVIFYLMVYVPASFITFGVLHFIEKSREHTHFGTLRGLTSQYPWVGFSLIIALLSMAGIPLTGGFIGKYLVFQEAFRGGQNLVVVIGAIMAVVGIAYYFRIINALYFGKPEDGALHIPVGFQIMFFLAAIFLLYCGIVPGVFMSWFH